MERPREVIKSIANTINFQLTRNIGKPCSPQQEVANIVEHSEAAQAPTKITVSNGLGRSFSPPA